MCMSEQNRIDNQLAIIALEAAQSVVPYLRSVARSNPEYTTKADFHDPVTVHDKHVEQVLRDFLSAAVPGCRFLGEEMGEEEGVAADPATFNHSGSASDLGSRLRWIIDPIDGTANFASGLIYFGTSIAAELDGSVIAGVVTVPCVGEAFVADARRAWHIDANGNEAEMRAEGPSSEATALLASYYPGPKDYRDHSERAAADNLTLYSAYGNIRRPGAGALDLAHVAAGWIGVAMGVKLKPWDVAAGIHMIQVAGGQVLNLQLGTDLPDGQRPGYVAQGRNLDAVTAKRVLEKLDAESKKR